MKRINDIRTLKILLLALVSGLSLNAIAHTNVVVIPLGGSDAKPIKNVVTVSAENGDYTTLQAAVAAITDSSDTNPYFIFLGPGTYTLTQPLTLKSGMHISGASPNIQNDVTIIKGAVSGPTLGSSSSLITTSTDTSLSNLSIENVTVTGTYTIGVYLEELSTLSDVWVYSSAVTTAYGIYGEGGIVYDSGIWVDSGNSTDIGLIANYSTTLDHVEIIMGGAGIGVKDSGSGSVDIRNSDIINSGSAAIEINNSDTKIVQTRVYGTITDNVSGTKNCLDVFDYNLTFVPSC